MSQLTLQVNNSLAVNILPSQEHEFLMTSKEVALGYGVKDGTIRESLRTHSDELLEGKHYVKGVRIPDTLAGTNLQPHQTFWTKRGIVRLGFFIKSERAKQFRDWAEDLIIYAQETSLFDRIAQLEARINQMQLPAIIAPSFEEVQDGILDYFKKYLRRGDIAAIAAENGYCYQYVIRVKQGQQTPGKKVKKQLQTNFSPCGQRAWKAIHPRSPQLES